MSLCKRCGKSFKAEDNFCGFCGYNLAAQDTSEMVTRIGLKATDIHFDLGVRYLSEGKRDQAVSAFKRILTEDPGDLRAREWLERAQHEESEAEKSAP